MFSSQLNLELFIRISTHYPQLVINNNRLNIWINNKRKLFFLDKMLCISSFLLCENIRLNFGLNSFEFENCFILFRWMIYMSYGIRVFLMAFNFGGKKLVGFVNKIVISLGYY